MRGKVRNPMLYCRKPGCEAYRCKGLRVCRVHGASSPAARVKRARAARDAEVAAAMKSLAWLLDARGQRALAEAAGL